MSLISELQNETDNWFFQEIAERSIDYYFNNSIESQTEHRYIIELTPQDEMLYDNTPPDFHNYIGFWEIFYVTYGNQDHSPDDALKATRTKRIVKNKTVIEYSNWDYFNADEVNIAVDRNEYAKLKEHNKLMLEETRLLRALKLCGVHTWEGYDVALGLVTNNIVSTKINDDDFI